ncbi:MAG TPA: transporter substrate-binding domain-containing protein [Bacteroidales bacterium]|nr:transporter substrate-binding domain-containing protein [Bacteroidales bacterium]
MHQYFKKLLFVVCFAIFAAPVFSNNPESFYPDSVITVGSEIDYPPFCILDENGEPDGFAVELFKEAARHVNLDLRFVTGTWDSVKNLLRTGQIDALPLVGRTPEREEYFDFTFPYMTLHGSLIVRKENNKIFSLADLKGKQVAVMKGDNAEEFMRRLDIDCELITTPTFTQALSQLDNGKYDAVVMQKLLALQLINQEEYENLKTVGPSLKEFPQHFTFAVHEGNKELLSLLNEGLSMVMTDGTYYSLRSKWFAPAFHKTVKERRIIIAGDKRYPPYDYLDENSQPTGFNTALTQAIAREMDVDIKIELMSWNEAREKLKEGKIDAIQGMYYSVERDQEFDLSPGFLKIRHVIISRKNGSKPETINDLKGKKIVVQKGDIMHDLVRQNDLDSNLITVESQDMAVKYVSGGKADAALVAQVQALYWMEQLNITNLRVAKDPVTTNDYCYSVKQGDQELLSIFSEGISILKAKGTYHDIYNKWLGEYGGRQYQQKDIFRYGLIAGLPVLLIVLIILIWNRMLKQQVNKKTKKLREEIEERKLFERKLSESNEQVNQQNEELQTLNEELKSSYEELETTIIKSRESEEMFRNLADSTPTAIMLFQDDKWIYANGAAQQMTGFNSSELLEQFFWDIVHSDFKEVIRTKGLERQEHDIGPGRYEICVVHKSGREVWTDLSAASITYKGRPAGIISAIDTTKRKQAEKALKTSLKEIEHITSNVPNIIWKAEIDEEGSFTNTFISDVADEFLALPSGTINNNWNTYFNYVKPKHLPGIQNTLKDGFKIPGKTSSIEYEVVKANGEHAWFLSTGKVYSEDKMMVYGYTVDITERKKSERELKELNKNLKIAKRKAEESDKLKLAFLLNISHEIRTPMNAIKGFSDILASEPLEEEHLRYIDIVKTNADQLLNIIDDVLLISRLQSEKMPMNEKEFVLDDFVNELLNSHGNLVTKKVRLKKTVPEEIRDIKVLADSEKLRRMISELLVNASKYTNDGIIELGVRRLDENKLQFSVSDTGCGIPEKEKEHIFDRFYRSENAQKNAIRGTGLGLSIVKYLTEFIDGELTVESREDEGSLFKVSVPVKFLGNHTKEITKKKDLTKGLGNVSLLVVEDEPDNYLLMEALLGGYVKSLAHAPDGKTALNLIKNNAFDLVLLDLRLPDISGLNVLDLGKSIQPNLKFIALTANAMPEDRAAALEAGCEAYITKPVERESLFLSIKKVLKL